VNLCDSNVWLALVLSGHGLHASAQDWLDAVDAPGSVCFCRATQQSFLRLLTNATVLGAYGNPPLTNRQAWGAYESLLDDDRFVFKEEPAGMAAEWKQFASRDTASPKLWMDAYLAAFAVVGGYRMVTNDSAYRQFTGLNLLILPQG
jgi:toxin-antitoxin system PIN domain toxin